MIEEIPIDSTANRMGLISFLEKGVGLLRFKKYNFQSYI